MRRFVEALLPLVLGATASIACAQKARERGGEGQATAPLSAPDKRGGPVETAPPNVPEFKPAFPEQTRARAMQTKTPIAVTTITHGLNKPWAIAFLPDGRMLVTEKPTGHLRVVSPTGEKSPPATGMPKVDGRDQGGLLDVELAPDFQTSERIYFTYYEPRKGGNGLAIAHAMPLSKLERPRSAARFSVDSAHGIRSTSRMYAACAGFTSTP